MIDFVTIDTAHYFSGNPIAEQHRLRFKSIIKRQDWSVPFFREMEFDQYDNPATKYVVYRDESGIARGVSRLYPTSLPYMLEQSFSDFVTSRPLPKSESIWEGSRFCIDENLAPTERKIIAREIVVAYLEVALANNVEGIVGLMYPAYWRNLFTSAGWNIEFLGEVTRLADGNRARAAFLPVSSSVLAKVREITGIKHCVTNFGGFNENEKQQRAA